MLQLGFSAHNTASGVFQASVNSYTFVDLSFEGITERSLRLIYTFLFFSIMGSLIMFE